MKRVVLLFGVLVIGILTFAQSENGAKKRAISIIAFYNLENLFDTIDDYGVMDQEFTPGGEKGYNGAIYWDKIGKLATVISQIGTDLTPDGPAILGVAEIENKNVLIDLANHELIRKRNYQFVHYDSKDARGVDVAMYYNPKYFVPEESRPLFVQLPGGSKSAYYTRDVLWVKGKFLGETIHVYVNHWPSRSGGEERSAPARAAAAMVVKNHLDSLKAADGDVKAVIMGDLNDDPISPSVTKVLETKGKKSQVKPGGLFNPWVDYYNDGIGTLAYQDSWNLFDQIIISYPWLNQKQNGWYFYTAKIFAKEYMKENLGRYKGYPMRTWNFNEYRGGYSDHFPTYIILLKDL